MFSRESHQVKEGLIDFAVAPPLALELGDELSQSPLCV